ncbi:MAG TPA: hypothetical protein VEB60_02350 [Candidatus Paceibacterota bacterium]|nr:hypothetical protein [Candidatus Paceibacterota bacterium]
MEIILAYLMAFWIVGFALSIILGKTKGAKWYFRNFCSRPLKFISRKFLRLVSAGWRRTKRPLMWMLAGAILLLWYLVSNSPSLPVQ